MSKIKKQNGLFLVIGLGLFCFLTTARAETNAIGNNNGLSALGVSGAETMLQKDINRDLSGDTASLSGSDAEEESDALNDFDSEQETASEEAAPIPEDEDAPLLDEEGGIMSANEDVLHSKPVDH